MAPTFLISRHATLQCEMANYLRQGREEVQLLPHLSPLDQDGDALPVAVLGVDVEKCFFDEFSKIGFPKMNVSKTETILVETLSFKD